MTLNQAITGEKRKLKYYLNFPALGNTTMANRHRQILAWLTELREFRSRYGGTIKK